MNQLHTKMAITKMVEHGQYIRTNSADRKALAAACLDYYHLDQNEYSCYIFPSGMSAISSLLTIFSGPDKQYLVGDEFYTDTTRFLVHLVDSGRLHRLHSYEKVPRPNTKYDLALFESCSNPHGHLPDYDQLKSREGMVRIIDNTWLSGCSFNPFHYGADIVVESMSKYLSDSKCIAGMVITKRIYADRIFEFIRLYGLHVTPETCRTILGTIGQTEQRIARSSQLTQEVIDMLKDQILIYPLINPTQIKYGPSIFVLYISLPSKWFPKTNIHRIKDRLAELVVQNGLHYETSFGSAYHRIDNYPKVISVEQRKVLLVRVYVGYDQPIDSLVNFLKMIST